MVDVSTREVFGSNLDSRPPSLGAASRRDPGGEHENEDPEPSGQDNVAARRPRDSGRRAKLSGGGLPWWRAGRAGRRRARGREEDQHRPRHSAPLHGFQHRGHGLDLLLQSRRPVAGLLRERGKARLQPGNPFTQLCHWVSKAAGCAASAASWGAAAVLAASSREATISASGSSSSSMGGDHHISLPSRRTGGAHGTWKQTLAWRPPSARRVPGRAVPPWPRTSARPSAAMPPRR